MVTGNDFSSQTNSAPRVAIFSVRNFENHVSRACGYEFEDVIHEQLDFARLIAPKSPGRSGIGRDLRNRVIRRTGLTQLGNMANFGGEVTPLEEDYELFFFSVAQPRDLMDLALVPNWRERSRFAACWFQELWVRDIPRQKHVLEVLNQFDIVYCPFYHTIDALQDMLDVPVKFMPWSTDAELFCPFPTPPARGIDVAGVGVVPTATEKALIRYADETGGFFQYQTVFGPSTIKSHRAHRANYAGLLKRSKYFLSYSAKFLNVAERGSQLEFGLRYVEGAASGTVLLGEPIDNPAYREWFDWQDAVIPLSVDEQAADKVIHELNADPDRLTAVRRANVTNALTRLDYLYRWQDILRAAKLPETLQMSRRRERLLDLAHMANTSDDIEGLAHAAPALSSSRA